MDIALWQLFSAILAYLGFLFLLAHQAERGLFPQRWLQHPLTYSLSLGVYATSWSYYGSVGLAASGGYTFLTIYLGVTIAFALSPLLLRPIMQLVRDYQLASLADLIAFRYRGRSTGFLVTAFMLVGTLPYISLQIRAVAESIHVLNDEAPPTMLALFFCLMSTVFAVLFGARHLTPREKHVGLVAAMAFESAFKLIALLCVGGLAVYGVFGGFSELNTWLQEKPEILSGLYESVNQSPWSSFMLLSFSAAFLLPRQYHMMFTENINPKALDTASWLFPTYLLLLNLPILPILFAGKYLQLPQSPDFYVLGVSLQSGHTAISILIFLGGIAAASGMVIVTTLALASMCLNHIFLPAKLVSRQAPADLYHLILWGKRLCIGLIIAAGYGFYIVIEHKQGLAQLGLISFVAVAQLLPGVLALLFWPRATRTGFVSGLVAGGLVWFGMLILPLLFHSQVLNQNFEMAQVFPYWGNEVWSAATFWTLLVNSTFLVLMSLATRPSLEEFEAAEICTRRQFTPLSGQVSAASAIQFRNQLAQIMGDRAAAIEVQRALDERRLAITERRPAELRLLRENIERNLSGLLGPVMAKLIVDDRLRLNRKSQNAFSDSLRYMESRVEDSRNQLRGMALEMDQLRRYHRDLLQELPVGVCALDAQRHVTVWNDALAQTSGISSLQAKGVILSQLPPPWGELLQNFADSDRSHVFKQAVEIHTKHRSFNLHKATLHGDAKLSPSAGSMVLLLEDRTDIDLLESELAHSERLASIGRFAAGVAHEIGNPLTGIVSITQNLKYEDDPQYIRASADDILEQSERISDIVQSLLRFSHGERQEGMSVSWCPLGVLVEEAIRLVVLGQRGDQLDFDVNVPETFEVQGDRQQLLQVLVNLLSNACDASPPGGTIRIRAKAREEFLRLSIQDQGVGIDDAVLQRVFEPFFTTKEVGKGTGLGLHLVHRIVRDHQGQIALRSQPEGGTTATLSLPIKQQTSLEMPSA